MPSKWGLGRYETGWTRRETFDPWLTENHNKNPDLLFVDGHKSHLTRELSVFYNNNCIILFSLPFNTIHIMHSANASVVKPLQNEWKVTVRNGNHIMLTRHWQNCALLPCWKRCVVLLISELNISVWCGCCRLRKKYYQ